MTAFTWTTPKDPDEVKDYVIDWTDRLNEDVIATSTWIVPDGITKDSDSFDADENTTTIWLSGGTLNDNYEFTNRITTTGGRTLDQTAKLKCRKM